jgi:antitoxin component YwqK of YwqJK toxin-antitoxin module
MATLAIESNGRIEKTAVYYNGEQISGIKELFLNLDESGTFDAIMQYEGQDSKIYTKNIFSDTLVRLKTTEPSFTEEEAENLILFTIESNGEIDNTALYQNDEPLEGVVSLFIHIKSGNRKSSILQAFSSNSTNDMDSIFKAEITFRNEDDSLETEDIF